MYNRLLSHNELATKGFMLRYRPWVIAHIEDYETKTEAIKRENYSKSTQGIKAEIIRQLTEPPHLLS